jgi:hypothetical protein
MWNGNAVVVRAFFLAISIVSITGCDTGAAPRQITNAARDALLQVELPVGRYQIDPDRNRFWFLTRDGVSVYDVSRGARAISLPDWILIEAPYSCLPDLVLGPKGEALITSNIVPTLWRIDPDTLAVSVHPLALDADLDKDVGFSALAYSPQHGGFLAASYIHGSLWRIDARLERAHKVPLSAPIPRACALAARSRRSHEALSRQTDLCVRTPHGDWSVIFASGDRSAYVRAAPCAHRPSPLDAVWLKGE